MGPEVWEVKWRPFWRKDENGLPCRRHRLIAARNVLTNEMKYFIANRVSGEPSVTLRCLLRVAFGRWPTRVVFAKPRTNWGWIIIRAGAGGCCLVIFS